MTETSPRPIFHLAFTVTDIAATRAFYCGVLGCIAGAQTDDWIILNFFGHKVTASLDRARNLAEPVHADNLALRHFGAFLDKDRFAELAARLTEAGAEFVIPPQERNAGTARAQWIMFAKDPSGNGLEFNCLSDPAMVFNP